jgi:hypothetical protein
MKLSQLFVGTATALAIAAAFGDIALAGTIPYPNKGTPNSTIYTFTATSSGAITAYFAGSGASYEEEVGMDVNGVPTGIVGLDDRTTAVGDSIVLGDVTAGDTLTFYDFVLTSGNTWSSNPSQNIDSGNHVYSTSATAGQAYTSSPAGTYVGFEDLAFPDSDYNYYDNTFVFTNTTTVTSGVPEPGTWAVMLLGLGGLGVAIRLARRRSSVALSAV